MKMPSLQNLLLAGLCLAVLAAPASATQTDITARLEPQSLTLGESAQLQVTIKGSQAAGPTIPDVDGLEIVSVGQQSSMQIINGVVSANVTHLYRITPAREGDFTIPAITAPGAGSSKPIALHVEKGAGGQSRNLPRHGRSQLPAPKPHRGADAAPAEAKGETAFLRVVLPKQELTVGEMVPVEVRAYFRAGVSASLNGLPMLSSDAFTLNKLGDKPEQAQEIIDGVPYTVVTWSTALSAVKAGDYPLNLDLPVMMRVKEKAKRSGRNPFKDFFGDDSPFGGSMLDDSFFDDFFGGATEKPVTLHTKGEVVKIKALPTEGRPADFSGAVGQFDVTSEVSANTGATGDPLTLKIQVAGIGNFDRVSTNGLPASSDWKSYKPSGKFKPVDSSGTAGSKTFEQAIVPIKAGQQEIPPLRFSYFDPETQSYVTKTTSPISVQVAQAGTVALVATNSAPASGPSPNAPKESADGLAADKAASVPAVSHLRPIVLAPWFIAINVAMFAALGAVMIVSRLRHRRANDPHRLNREAANRAVREALAAMDAAVKAEDAPRFFTAARCALQERLAARWHLPVSLVTISEIRSRLNGQGEDLRTIFQTADEIAYAGQSFTAPDLQHWRDIVKNQLHQIAVP